MRHSILCIPTCFVNICGYLLVLVQRTSQCSFKKSWTDILFCESLTSDEPNRGGLVSICAFPFCPASPAIYMLRLPLPGSLCLFMFMLTLKQILPVSLCLSKLLAESTVHRWLKPLSQFVTSLYVQTHKLVVIISHK